MGNLPLLYAELETISRLKTSGEEAVGGVRKTEEVV
jgi:hypothetical protein